MSRLIAIGDIHGHALTLESLLNRIAPTTEDKLVFIGDYIDRGPRSKEVIQIILALRSSGIECRTLMGNHESALIDILGYARMFPEGVIDGGESLLIIPGNGLPQTVQSYGWRYEPGAPLALYSNSYRLPETHLNFFMGLELYHLMGKLLFVHAHVDRFSLQERTASLAVKMQMEYNPFAFLNERDAMYETKVFPELLIHGHTPVHYVTLPNGTRRPDNEIRILDGRLNIDTGIAGHNTHLLSAVHLNLEGEIIEYWQERDLDC